MKIILAQQNYHIGNFESNTHKIIEAIKTAKNKQADLIVFSEMCICGYPARDFLDFNDFINKCYESIESIKQYADTIGVIVGAPDRNPAREGKDLFNAAFLLYEKKIKKIALTICENIWNLGDNPLYRICPMDILMQQNPEVMINISASPFDYTHIEDRKAIIKANVLKYKLPLIYCNSVGSQTEIVFDGASLVFDKDANLCYQLSQFKEEIAEIELNTNGSINAP